VLALAALDVLPAGEGRVLDALLVDGEDELGPGPVTLAGRSSLLLLAAPVDAVVGLVPRARTLEVAADATLVDQGEGGGESVPLEDLLLGLEHVVALFAEAHTSECHDDRLRIYIIINNLISK
jgi:hypothetical protein